MVTTEAPNTTPAAAPAGMTLIHNVALEEIEKAIYAREHEQASTLLLTGLRKLKAGGTFIGYPNDARLLARLYTRLAAAIVTLIADPKFNLSQDGFDHFAAEHAITDMVFRASAFETSDHLLAQLADRPGPDPTKLKMSDGAALMKFLTTYSLRSGFALNFEATFKRSPQTIFALYAGMLSPLLTVAVQAQERREALLGLHAIFADVRPTDAVLPTLSDAYMYASYGLRRDKHDIKAAIHRMLERMMYEKGVPVPTAEELAARRKRSLRIMEGGRQAGVDATPTILICLEWFNTNHAMYRCYAPIIRQLRARFRLVAMSIAGAIDEDAKREFDEWHEVPFGNLVLADLVRRINDIAPDVVYYPSVGMALWWVALASVRLAPVQVITLGHPATTRSQAIDYVLCDEGAIGDAALFSEQIIEYPNGSARYIMRPDADMPDPRRDDDHPETIHVAVPAMLCKLNADFMRVCRSISERAQRPVVFHFFINMLGVNLFQSAREIRDWLPTAKIYERRHYNQYMRELRECHLHLSTFPFGGTNSVIDSMLLGLPLVSLWGDEPHARFDGMVTRRAGLPEELVAKTREDYVDAAVRLINDDDYRNGLRDHLLGFDLQGEFFGEPPAGQRTAFLDAMVDAYERGPRDGR